MNAPAPLRLVGAASFANACAAERLDHRVPEVVQVAVGEHHAVRSRHIGLPLLQAYGVRCVRHDAKGPAVGESDRLREVMFRVLHFRKHPGFTGPMQERARTPEMFGVPVSAADTGT